MQLAATAPLPLAAGWGAAARRDRLLRRGLVFTTAVALHVGAAVLFVQGTGTSRGIVTPLAAPVAMLWLVPGTASVRTPAVTPPRAVKPRAVAQTRTALSQPVVEKAHEPAAEETPVESAPETEARVVVTVDVRETATSHAPAAAAPAGVESPALLAAAPAPAPTYAIARRSVVFGGAARQDDTAAPAKGARPLANWLQEGIARSVWPVANALAAAGDGACRLTHAAPQWACDTDALATSLPAEAERSLATWVQSGLVNEIEIRIEGGVASYAVR